MIRSWRQVISWWNLCDGLERKREEQESDLLVIDVSGLDVG